MNRNLFDPTEYKNVDAFRRTQLAIAEFIDAWRIIPRVLVVGYGYVLVKTLVWYMSLESYMIPGCTIELAETCIAQAPATPHTILLSTIVAIAAPVFGLYTSSGKKWNGFTAWVNTAAPPKIEEYEELPEVLPVPEVPVVKKR